MKKLLSILLCTVLVMALTPVTAFAAVTVTLGDFVVVMPASNDASFGSGVLSINKPGDYIISMRSGVTSTSNCIWIPNNNAGSVTITLKDVIIDNPSNGSALGISISANVTVTLILEGDSKLTSPDEFAGINVPNTASLTIKSTTNGSLEVNGGYGAAGIGGNHYMTCGSITIESGTVTATGGNGGAGIGGGGTSTGGIDTSGNITISGGTVTATGGDGDDNIGSGAGIGGGASGSGGNITISGGTVTAKGGGGSSGSAGIGGGSSGGGGDIKINGGTVTATGGEFGAGIGGGSLGYGGNITINGGSIIAKGGVTAAGIGGGGGGPSGDITIGQDAIVAAFGGNSKDEKYGAGAGIGGGGGAVSTDSLDGSISLVSAGGAGNISIEAPGVYALGGMNHDGKTRNTAVGGGTEVGYDDVAYSYTSGTPLSGITEYTLGALTLYNIGSDHQPTPEEMAVRAAMISQMLNISTPPGQPEQAKPLYIPGAVGGNMSAVSAFIGDAALQYAAYHGDRVIAFLDNNPSSYARRLIAGAKPYAYSGSTRIDTFEIYIPLPIASDLQAALISMGAERVTIDDRVYLRLYY